MSSSPKVIPTMAPILAKPEQSPTVAVLHEKNTLKCQTFVANLKMVTLNLTDKFLEMILPSQSKSKKKLPCAESL